MGASVSKLNIPNIPYGKQSVSFSDRLFVFRALSSPLITQGPESLAFEREISEKVQSEYCVVFSSGTAALHATAHVAHAAGHKRALVPNLTFIATLNAFRYVGAELTIGDISERDWNLDWSELDSQYDVVAPVDFGGAAVNYSDFPAKRWSGLVIEDASHGLGAVTPDGPVGNCSRSDMTVFSFHPVKAITTGEGGAVTTNSREIYQELLLFRSHGILRDDPTRPWRYDIHTLGYNYRLSDFQAALGRRQLRRLDEFIERRGGIAEFYRQAFAAWPVKVSPPSPAGFRHAYHLFQIEVPNRDYVLASLHAAGIKGQVHYPPLTDFSINAGVLTTKPELPVSARVATTAVSLPVWPGLRQSQLRLVVATLEGILDNNTRFLAP